ncbi:MAG: trigger factor family protein, partial [Clostridia bacterium]|nr:trigger factor family protein [Clostridia bacterium]
MKVTDVKKLEKSEVSITVEVKGETFEKATEAAYRKNAKQIRVPGFRPGKATRRQIEALYGEGVFYDDAIKA